MELPLPTVPVSPDPAPPLRPLTLGEILDRALQLFRGNFLRLFTMVAVVYQGPIYILTKVWQGLLQTHAPVLARPGAFRGVLPGVDQFVWLVGGSLVYFILAFVLYQFLVAALSHAAARSFMGETLETGPALREGFARAPQVLGSSTLLMLLFCLACAIAMVPGVALIAGGSFLEMGVGRLFLVFAGLALAVLAPAVVTLYLMLRYALVTQLVVVERLSSVAALRRSAQLMAGRVGTTLLDSCKVRASVVLAVNLCISISVLVVTSIPGMAVNSAFGVSPFNPEGYDPTLVPLWVQVPVELFQMIGQAALAPYGVLAMVVFYFDLRIRREGFDLEVLASRLGGSR